MVITLIYGWLLSLLLIAVFPFIAVLVMIQSTIQKKSGKKIMKSYSQSAGYAEQALGSIKVVQTYGQEQLELDVYAKYLDQVKVMSDKQGTAIAMTAGIFTFCSTAYFGYNFFLSGILRSHRVKNDSIINMNK